MICPNEVKTESCVCCARELGWQWFVWECTKGSLINCSSCQIVPAGCNQFSQTPFIEIYPISLICLLYWGMILLTFMYCLYLAYPFPCFLAKIYSDNSLITSNYDSLWTYNYVPSYLLPVFFTSFWLYKFYLEDTSDKVQWPLS